MRPLPRVASLQTLSARRASEAGGAGMTLSTQLTPGPGSYQALSTMGPAVSLIAPKGPSYSMGAARDPFVHAQFASPRARYAGAAQAQQQISSISPALGSIPEPTPAPGEYNVDTARRSVEKRAPVHSMRTSQSADSIPVYSSSRQNEYAALTHKPTRPPGVASPLGAASSNPPETPTRAPASPRRLVETPLPRVATLPSPRARVIPSRGAPGESSKREPGLGSAMASPAPGVYDAHTAASDRVTKKTAPAYTFDGRGVAPPRPSTAEVMVGGGSRLQWMEEVPGPGAYESDIGLKPSMASKSKAWAQTIARQSTGVKIAKVERTC